ncbi:16S rRNA (cytidine(1402)-2'-O)-methyltransferase [Candidatus Pelagibacter sp. HIMB1521]|uniref:16S rRNA (cytidine(1402)-2'-O)-methyltransferase n=1 Tax=Candidatus Pelagibacter sp. HIMB1521 TaxID=3413344 RepID=UPI003F85890E
MFTKSQFKSNDYKNGLYLVATPIGNLKDISFRSLEILEKSDYILCEDTRVSKHLLEKYQIKSKLISNHKFNEKKNTLQIIEYLKSGKLISLISDAGTPSISDPGLVLVNECIRNNLNIFSIPGPSAVTTAVAASGFSDKFIFYGFLPEKKNQIEDELKKLSNFNHSLVFFSSSKKINKLIPAFKKFFNGRKIVFCRELSKLYEEYIRKNIDELELFNNELKGELTIVISEKKEEKASQNLSESDINLIKKMINKLTTKEITDLICNNKNIPKKVVYNFCLKLKNEI